MNFIMVDIIFISTNTCIYLNQLIVANIIDTLGFLRILPALQLEQLFEVNLGGFST